MGQGLKNVEVAKVPEGWMDCGVHLKSFLWLGPDHAEA